MKRNWSRRELEFLGEPINPELPSRLERKAGGGGKGSAPPPPDYAGAAEKQAQSSMEFTKYQTQANRPNIVTPFGTQTWTGGADNNWTQTTTLNPDAQSALDSQLKMQQGRSDIANSMMPQAHEAITKPIDYNSMIGFGNAPTQSNFQTAGNAPQLQTKLDTSGVPGMPTFDSNYVQGLQNQALEYMRPDMMAQTNALEAKLAAQGVTPGSQAYESAVRRQADQQARDKYQALATALSQGNAMYANQLAANNQGFNQAAQAFSLGNSAMQGQNQMNLANAGFNNDTMQNQFAQQQGISEYQNRLRQQQIAEAQMRQVQPLNNINALLTGQQVGMPQMPSFNTAGAAQPINYLGASNMLGNYNMQAQAMNNASSNSLLGGAFGLGGQLGAAYMLSDRRLKRDIKRVGKLGKFNLYEYRYIGSQVRHVGVMADEVKKVQPQSVVRHRSGYDMVNYATLGA